MAKQIVSARIPPELKAQGDAILAQLGITPTRAIVLFYEAVVERQGLPWMVGAIEPEAEAALMHIETRRGGETWVVPLSPMPSKSTGN